jgi:parvulin-like peptidyl-prolyl isomerase
MVNFSGSSYRLFVKNHRTLMLSAACTVALAVSACGARSESGNIVARSDLGSVSRADLEAFILDLDEDRRRPVDGQTLHDWRAEVAKDLMVAQAMKQRAETLSDDPDIAAKTQETRDSVLTALLEHQLIDARIDVTEEDLREFYDQHPEEFSHDEQIRLRHIFRRIDRDAGDTQWQSARHEMEDLLKKLRDGAHFGDLARSLSDSETAHQEGLIGRLDRGALPPSVEAVVWNLKTGEISDVIKTPVGFHIFRLDDHLAPFHMEFEEARSRILRRLEAAAREQFKDEAFTRLLTDSGAEFMPEYLGSAGESPPDQVLFSLDETVITIADFQLFQRQAPFLRQHQISPEEWLSDLVWPRLLVWHADQIDLESDPAAASEIEDAVAQIQIRIGVEDYLGNLIESISGDGLLEDYYEAHKNRFQTPKMLQLRLIVVDFGPNESHYGVYEQLDRLADDIRNQGRDMGAAAEALSDDFTASNGGLTGWVFLDALGTWAGPRVQKSLAAMDIGEISEPLLIEHYDQIRLTFSRQGYLLVRLEAVRMPEFPAFEATKEQVIQRYIETHLAEMEAQIRAEVLDSINATVLQDN